MMSARVGSSAVAVSAMRGTSGKRSCSTRELPVLRTEVVSPHRDAVRLVDREQRRRDLVQQVHEPRRHAAAPARRRGGRVSPSSSSCSVFRAVLDVERASSGTLPARRAAAARSPGPASARSAARSRCRCPPGRAPAPGSKATSRRRSASGRGSRRRRPRARRSRPGRRGTTRSRRLSERTSEVCLGGSPGSMMTRAGDFRARVSVGRSWTSWVSSGTWATRCCDRCSSSSRWRSSRRRERS